MKTKEIKKPKVKLSGQDGNVFNLIGICARALEKAGLKDEAKEMRSAVFVAKSYDESLQIMMRYCEVS